MKLTKMKTILVSALGVMLTLGTLRLTAVEIAGAEDVAGADGAPDQSLSDFTDAGSGWLASAETAGETPDNNYGWEYKNQGAFRLVSEKTVWADKFGLAFRLSATESEGFRLIISNQKNVWYEQAEQSVSMLFKPVMEDGEITASTVSLYEGTSKIGEYETVMFNWTDDKSYSTNYVYLGKDGDNWIININDVEIDADAAADAALDEALGKFSDKCGCLQIENAGGPASFTFVGVQYGVPTGSTTWKNDDFSVGPVLSAPRWSVVSGDELVAWTSDFGSAYTIDSSLKAPLNGFDMKMRLAHGEGASNVLIAMTSLYGGANWYASTYGIVFRILWDPSYDDNTAQVQMLIYHPDTASSGEEPIKLTAIVRDFGWFTGTEFNIGRNKGVWNITLNGVGIFDNKISSEGKTVNDYLQFIFPYYESGVGYVQVWEPAASGKSELTNTGYVIERLAVGKSNAAPRFDYEAMSAIMGKTYVPGETITIDLSKLFTDGDGDSMTYFATKGSIDGNIWTYHTSVTETLFVTFTASDGTTGTTNRIVLDIVSNADKADSGCSGAITGSPWLIATVMTAALVVLFTVKRPRDRRKK